MTDVIGSVGLLVRPITTKFAAETESQVKEALRGVKVDAPTTNFESVEKSARKAKDALKGEFNEAAKDSNRALGGIGNDRTFAAAERNARVAAANIRREMERAAFESDRALRSVGGGGGDRTTRRSVTGGSGGPGRDIEQLLKAGAGLAAGLSALKIPIVIQGAAAAIGSVTALTSAVIALSGALSTLSGAAVGIPVVYSALGQAFGVAKLASGGIAEALKAQSTQQEKAGVTAKKAADDEVAAAASRRAAAERIIDASQALARSQTNLTRAQESLTRAQEALGRSYKDAAEAIEDARFASADAIIGEERARLSILRTELAQRRLNESRRQAIEDLEDLKLAMEGSALSEQRARIRLEEAIRSEAELRDRAAQTGTVSANDLASATLAVREAEHALREVIEGRGDQQERLIEVQKAAAGQDEETALAAQESALAIREAQLGLLKAIDNRIDRQDILAEMEMKGIDRSDIVVRAQEEVARAQEGVRDAVQGVENANRGLTEALLSAAEAARKFGADGSGSVDEFKEAMEGLSPAARAFVDKIIEMKERFKALRDIAAENMFPGVIAGLDAVTPLFADLEPVIGATGRVMGALAKRAGELVGSPAFRSDIVRLGQGNIAILGNMGETVLSLVSALKDIMVVGQPLVEFMSVLGRRFADSLAGTVAAARESGGLADFFEKTKSTLLDVISIVGDAFSIIRNLFSAGFPEGARYLFDLRVVFENIRGIVQGAAQSGELAGWFERARPSAEAIAGIFGDLLVGLGRIGAELGPKLAPVLEQIREDLVPAVLAIVNNVDTGFLSALVSVTTEAAKFVDTFMQATPVLTAILNGLDGILKVVNFLGNELGPVSTVLVNVLAAFTTLGTVLAAFKIASIISNFAGLSAGIKGAADMAATLRTNLLLLNSGNLLGSVAGVIGALGIAVGVGLLAWNQYSDSVSRAKSKMDEFKTDIVVNDLGSMETALNKTKDAITASKDNFAIASEGWTAAGQKTTGTMGAVNTALNTVAAAFGDKGSKAFLQFKADTEAGEKSLKDIEKTIETVRGNTERLASAHGLNAEEVIKLANAHKIDLSEGYDKINVRMGEAVDKTRDSVLATHDLSGEYEIMASAASTVTEKMDAFNSAIDKTLGTTLSLFDAQTDTQESLERLGKAYEDAGGKADLHTTAGRKLRDALSATTRGLGEEMDAAIKSGASTADITARTNEYITRLQALQKEYPGLKGEIQTFIDQLKKVPPNTNTVAHVDTAQARRNISDLTRDLNELQGRLDRGIAFNAGGGVRLLAAGAVVKKPEFALIGEAGPEVVIPLTDAKRASQLVAESGLLDVLAKAPNLQSQRAIIPTRTGSSHGPGVVFGPGSVVVQFNGSVTPDEARMVGQQLGRGIEDVMAAQEAQVEAGAY